MCVCLLYVSRTSIFVHEVGSKGLLSMTDDEELESLLTPPAGIGLTDLNMFRWLFRGSVGESAWKKKIDLTVGKNVGKGVVPR